VYTGRLVEMDNSIELIAQPREEVVVKVFGLRAVDHADGSLQPGTSQCAGRRCAAAQWEQEPRPADVMKQ